jgi:gliding motility-associated-like protein
MYIKRLKLLLSLLLLIKLCTAQPTTCTTLGQNPGTAFPVCGTSVFSQSTVPACGGRTVPYPCNDNLATDINPYWYKFTCFTGGTLGFVITPNNLNEDYDWQIFDITNHNPTDVYTDASLFVACDWSGEFGLTGASSSGTSLVRCGGLGIPLFSSMPTLIQGHNYLLLISHFTVSQSGYTLSFGGGTAIITDSTQPHLVNATASCDNTQIYINLNKKMLCNSLAVDGSDFSITPNSASIISATSTQCSNGFDMDSINLTFSNSLIPGSYTVTAKNGTDGNTLLDYCGNSIPVGENIPLTIIPPQLSLMDSITTVGCSPDVLQLVFTKPIRCNSIEPGGSDFIVTGSSPVSVISANGICNNGLSNVVLVHLSSPIKTKGNYTIKLVTGSDGNTLIGECGEPVPAGSSLNFSTADTVSAAFAYNIYLGCKIDTIDYSHNGQNEVNMWQWNFDNINSSNLQNPSVQYSIFGQKQASLTVSNGVCSDTASTSISLNNELKASFEGTNLVCSGEDATFKDNSIGNIVSWSWNFSNGNASTLQQPPAQTYSSLTTITNVPVKLTITNDIGCTDSATQIIQVVDNCYIAVPSAFTPNNDGLNDYLYPLNAYKATNLIFKVFNRFGQLVFETTDWTNKWNGTINGQPADAGTYVWLLQYTDSDTGKKHFSKGTSVLIR